MKSPVNLGNSGSINEETGSQKAVIHKLHLGDFGQGCMTGEVSPSKTFQRLQCGATTTRGIGQGILGRGGENREGAYISR